MGRNLKRVLIGVACLFVAIQLVPYGRTNRNPRVTQEAPWTSAEAKHLAETACYDCHSNKTKWPVYANIAPISWWVANHVQEGRDALNFTEWDKRQEVDELAKIVNEGEMPPGYYTAMHGSAKLTAAQKETLVTELRKLAATKGGGSERGGEAEGGGDRD